MGARERLIMVEVDGVEVGVPRKSVRKTRNGGRKAPKEKFDFEKESVAMPFKPIGDAQTLALDYMQSGRKVVLLTGPAGGGKSIVAAYHAANQLREKEIDKLYLVRPYEPCGRSIGAVPGTESEKLSVIFTSIIDHLTKFLGKQQIAYMLEKKIIEYKSVEWLRGTSFEEGCLVLCEEVQGFDVDMLQMLTTRIGGAQLLCTGDERQKDIKRTTGISYLKEQLEAIKASPPKYLDEEDINELTTNIGFVTFTFEDSGRRSKLTKALVKLFYYE